MQAICAAFISTAVTDAAPSASNAKLLSPAEPMLRQCLPAWFQRRREQARILPTLRVADRREIGAVLDLGARHDSMILTVAGRSIHLDEVAGFQQPGDAGQGDDAGQPQFA